jgi:hypothetical protein
MPTAPYYDLYICSCCNGGMARLENIPNIPLWPPLPINRSEGGRLVTYHSPTRFGWQKRDSGWVCPDCIAKEKS